jgi:hypothetical protein
MDLAAVPNGDLLLLEALRPSSGRITQTRVRRISSEQISIGATLQAEEMTVPGRPFKGASVRRGPSGTVSIYVVRLPAFYLCTSSRTVPDRVNRPVRL